LKLWNGDIMQLAIIANHHLHHAGETKVCFSWGFPDYRE
jgi:hypothetical protein